MLIFRTHPKYIAALRIWFGYALPVTAFFAGIVLANVLVIAGVKLLRHCRRKVE